MRLGVCFALAEISMQAIGYFMGSGAGRIFGEIAEWIGLALLALVGLLMIRESHRGEGDPGFDMTRGWGLLVTSLSISLDSLGVGFALPAIGVPLITTLVTVSISTTIASL